MVTHSKKYMHLNSPCNHFSQGIFYVNWNSTLKRIMHQMLFQVSLPSKFINREKKPQTSQTETSPRAGWEANLLLKAKNQNLSPWCIQWPTSMSRKMLTSGRAVKIILVKTWQSTQAALTEKHSVHGMTNAERLTRRYGKVTHQCLKSRAELWHQTLTQTTPMCF